MNRSYDPFLNWCCPEAHWAPYGYQHTFYLSWKSIISYQKREKYSIFTLPPAPAVRVARNTLEQSVATLEYGKEDHQLLLRALNREPCTPHHRFPHLARVEERVSRVYTLLDTPTNTKLGSYLGGWCDAHSHAHLYWSNIFRVGRAATNVGPTVLA